MTEYILCAAIYYDDGKHHPGQPPNIDTGFVRCGYRHGNVVAQWAIQYDNAEDMPQWTRDDTQGFLTSHGRFVDRVEAYKLALAAGQVKASPVEARLPYLFSEDLY